MSGTLLREHLTTATMMFRELARTKTGLRSEPRCRAPGVLDARKLGAENALGLPVTFERLHLAASHEKLSVILLEGTRDLLAVLLEPCRVGHLVIDDEIRRHARTSASRRRELSQSSDVPHR